MNRPYSLETKIREFAKTYNAGTSKVFNRSWSGEVTNGNGYTNYFILNHYGTPIVKIDLVSTVKPEMLEGRWDSVSDIQGINKAFDALNLPYHYSKKGGLRQYKPWNNQPVGPQYCSYLYDGRDTDGTKWYRCVIHDETAPSQDAPCAGYEEAPYIIK